ncbi:DUF6919 domain-containing protein [Streptomyces mirabilis]|uniref:DUF6919 domain-containing protein n=1 Tax=Streptomyces mirabilis TaxID=68239 RepID=UPI0033CD7047
MTQDVTAQPVAVSPQWRTASTLTDLGRLNADWLQGRLQGEHPNGPDEVADQIRPLVPTLAAANTAGFVTLAASIRPGKVRAHDGERWEQLATVTGLIARDSDELLHRIATEAWRAGIQVFVHHPAAATDSWPIAVTTYDGEPVEFAGHRIGMFEMEALWEEGTQQAAVTSTTAAIQVTLIDPEIGRDHRLWLVLDAVCGRTST